MFRSILQMGKPAPRVDPEANKRRAGRVACAGVKTSWGEVINASRTGMRISARRKALPPPGQVGVLTVFGPEGAFKVAARVVWSRKQNWGRAEAGLQFVEVPAAARAHLGRLAEYAARDTTLDGLTADGFTPNQ
ncbi:MAG: PilZ domain-containing protein [Planctomycetota bacterium]|nr:PilZ domain-containing protein [Planctomycetota bacterium]